MFAMPPSSRSKTSNPSIDSSQYRKRNSTPVSNREPRGSTYPPVSQQTELVTAEMSVASGKTDNIDATFIGDENMTNGEKVQNGSTAESSANSPKIDDDDATTVSMETDDSIESQDVILTQAIAPELDTLKTTEGNLFEDRSVENVILNTSLCLMSYRT